MLGLRLIAIIGHAWLFVSNWMTNYSFTFFLYLSEVAFARVPYDTEIQMIDFVTSILASISTISTIGSDIEITQVA